MKSVIASLAFCAFLLSAGCASLSTVGVDYEYDPEIDFTLLQAYDWFPIPERNVRYDLLVKQIRRAVKSGLDQRGYRKDSNSPDFLIALHGGFQTHLNFSEWQFLHEYYQKYWTRRRIDVIKYEDRQLIVDFIDARTGELVYRGTASASLIPEPTGQKRQEIIDEAVAKVLEKFFYVSQGAI